MRVIFAHPENFCFFIFLAWVVVMVVSVVGFIVYDSITKWKEKRDAR